MNRDPWFRNRLIRDAIYAAIAERMEHAPIWIVGEGAQMKVHFDAPEIERRFFDRVLTLPISEDASVNFALGLALQGQVPIVDIITADFIYRAFDSICNTVAKEEFVDGGKTIIIRAEFMPGGPTTGQRPEAHFMHVPGLNVIVPSNPRDAYGLMKTALATKAATLFFEDRSIEDAKTLDADKRYDGAIPLGSARIRHAGDHLTVVAYGLMIQRLEALPLDDLGWELIDLRTLWPLDVEAVLESAAKTGALLVVEPDVEAGGVGAEVLALAAPTVAGRCGRVGGLRQTMPACREHHDRMVPSADEILAVGRALAGEKRSAA